MTSGPSKMTHKNWQRWKLRNWLIDTDYDELNTYKIGTQAKPMRLTNFSLYSAKSRRFLSCFLVKNIIQSSIWAERCEMISELYNTVNIPKI